MASLDDNADDDRTVRAYSLPLKSKLEVVDLDEKLSVDDYALLRANVQEALLDPHEDIRIKALSLIQNQRVGDYLIVGGFAPGDSLFLTIENGQGPQKIGYVSKIPAEYLGRETHPFGIVPEEFLGRKVLGKHRL